MKRKWMALLLALATVLSLFAASAAAEGTQTAKTLSFDSIAGLVLRNNYTVLSLDETIAMLDEIDYDEMEDMLRDNIDQLEQSKQLVSDMSDGVSASIDGLLTSYEQIANMLARMPGVGGETVDLSQTSQLLTGYVAMNAKQSLLSIESSITALEQQLDGIDKQREEGELSIRQMETAKNQLVMAAQSLYIGLLGLQRSDAAVTRSMEALDRTIKEMELRSKMGQISDLQLRQVQFGRTQVESKQQTLRMNMDLLNMQLNSMIGEIVGENLTLAPLPEVTEQQLAAMDFVNDYKKAEKVSYEVYAAQKSFDDAEDAYDDAVKEYGKNSKEQAFTAAEHNYHAAEYTYQASMQSYSIKFRTLFLQVKDYAQVLATAKENQKLKEAEYEAAKLKCQRGTISENACLDARDEVETAKDSVATAASDLFSAYNNYCWAVSCGILN